MAAVEAVAFGVPVHPVSCLDDVGLEGLEHLAGNQTAALLGSSGVGKSSLLNRLLGWDRRSGERRARRREGPPRRPAASSYRAASGGLVLDTPGMRASSGSGARRRASTKHSPTSRSWRRCRFNDCGHETEPGCAVPRRDRR